MPVFDDDLDDPPLAPQPPRPGKPPMPKPEPEPGPAPAARPPGARNPLIPRMSLYGWTPDPAAVAAALSHGGDHAREPGRNR